MFKSDHIFLLPLNHYLMSSLLSCLFLNNFCSLFPEITILSCYRFIIIIFIVDFYAWIFIGRLFFSPSVSFKEYWFCRKIVVLMLWGNAPFSILFLFFFWTRFKTIHYYNEKKQKMPFSGYLLTSLLVLVLLYVCHSIMGTSKFVSLYHCPFLFWFYCND